MTLLQNLFAGLSGPKNPVHVGEVMALWTGMVALDEGRALMLTLLNQTTDPELKRFMEQYIKDFDEPQQKTLSKFLREEGIPHPPVTADKPKANEADVPPGAKFSDAEIANLLVVKLVNALQLCTAGLVQSLRPDVGAMFLAAQSEILRNAVMLKGLMVKRGWLKVPPYWRPSKVED